MIRDIIDPKRIITRQRLEMEIMLKVSEIKQRIAVLQAFRLGKK
jgi:uncharacterized small protein (DUF1192 family)